MDTHSLMWELGFAAFAFLLGAGMWRDAWNGRATWRPTAIWVCAIVGGLFFVSGGVMVAAAFRL